MSCASERLSTRSAIAASDGAGSGVADAGASAAEGTDVRAPVVVVAVVSSKRSDSESVVAAEAADVPSATVAGEALPCLLPMWPSARSRAVFRRPWAFCPDAPRRRRRQLAARASTKCC